MVWTAAIIVAVVIDFAWQSQKIREIERWRRDKHVNVCSTLDIRACWMWHARTRVQVVKWMPNLKGEGKLICGVVTDRKRLSVIVHAHIYCMHGRNNCSGCIWFCKTVSVDKAREIYRGGRERKGVEIRRLDRKKERKIKEIVREERNKKTKMSSLYWSARW